MKEGKWTWDKHPHVPAIRLPAGFAKTSKEKWEWSKTRLRECTVIIQTMSFGQRKLCLLSCNLTPNNLAAFRGEQEAKPACERSSEPSLQLRDLWKQINDLEQHTWSYFQWWPRVVVLPQGERNSGGVPHPGSFALPPPFTVCSQSPSQVCSPLKRSSDGHL